MNTNNKFVSKLSDIDSKSTSIYGGKASNLGELIKSGINVPPGFALSKDLYFDFINNSKIQNTIEPLLTDSEKMGIAELQKVSTQIKNLIDKSDLDVSIIQQISDEYKILGSPRVAVRSSATSEDSMEASFAGQQNTYLNIQGLTSLMEAIKSCWASVFEARAIFYRNSQNLPHFDSGMSVVIQTMVQPDVSGVMFTLEPTTLRPEGMLKSAKSIK